MPPNMHRDLVIFSALQPSQATRISLYTKRISNRIRPGRSTVGPGSILWSVLLCVSEYLDEMV
jgi:hypothetical protein